ncbi:MAG: SH3 domain-containing protein [Paludibacteraceae bacterium]|nr:SH3 domain-containing protein [Paludibacteraceae bacterium]MBR4839487.1 SH3 domain-containing protein [Paludibacteraceae bacterium]
MATLSTQDDIRAAFKAGESTTVMKVNTNKDNLNLRDTPSTNGKILLTLPKGTEVHVFNSPVSVSGWKAVYYVNAENLKVFGFCSADYLA